MGDNGLHGEVGAFAPLAHALHRRGEHHNGGHAIAGPEQTHAGNNGSSRGGVERRTIEVHGGEQHAHGKGDARLVYAEAPHHTTGHIAGHKRGGSAHDAEQKANLFHRVAKVHHIGAQHREDANDAGIVEDEKAHLSPDAGGGEKPHKVGEPCPVPLFPLFNLDVAVEHQGGEGQQHKGRQAGNNRAPTVAVEHHDEQAAANNHSAKLPHRLHAVHHAALLRMEGEHGQRVGGNVLCGRGCQRERHQGENPIDVGVDAEKGGEKEQHGVC